MAIESCIIFDCSDPEAPVPIGRFGLDAHGNGRFGYGLRYLRTSRAFSLDPIHVPLQAPEIAIPRRGDGTYGVFQMPALTPGGHSSLSSCANQTA
jgi:serine/threonine-protein kinase HipA